MNMENDIQEAAKIISTGGIILYPTDTIWGIGCDATNEKAIKKIYALKKRDEKKSMIILLASIKEIDTYVSAPSKKILDFLSVQMNPTTAIFEHGINLPKSLINSDNTIAIRIVKDPFCQSLIRACKVPLISTSANVSGKRYAANFNEISEEIKIGVAYVVRHRRNDFASNKPSSIIKLDGHKIVTIR